MTSDGSADCMKLEGHRSWIQWEISRILKWRYVSTIFLAKFCGDILLHRPEK
jgi:hypothetical protein